MEATHTIVKNDMERQIFEMWDAISTIPNNDPDRDFAISQAQGIENNLRDNYRKQEQLRNAAPDLLDALQEIINSYDGSEDNAVSWVSIDKGREAIKKAIEDGKES